MNGLFDAALEIQQFVQSRSWSYCIIGGLAVIRWGESRMTQDVDLSLLTGFGDEKPYVLDILKTFRSRIPQAEIFALQYRTLLIAASNGTAIDISLAALPFEEQMIERATSFAFAPECSLLTCSAEDVIVLKAFANRAKDWIDIEGILIRQHQALDTSYILTHLTPLCDMKETPEIIEKFQELLAA